MKGWLCTQARERERERERESKAYLVTEWVICGVLVAFARIWLYGDAFGGGWEGG